MTLSHWWKAAGYTGAIYPDLNNKTNKQKNFLKSLFLLLEGKVTLTCVNVLLRMWEKKDFV